MDDFEVVQLTRTLVDIDSTTGEEGEVVDYLAGLLDRLGYVVELDEVAPGRSNLFASAGGAARVVLSTHVDTVPPFVPSREDDAYVYGRGSCDAKGIVAAQIAAAERLRAEGRRGIGLLFLVDEEAGSEGARVANRHPAASWCDFLIGGEPTRNRIASATKGSLRARVSTEGREAHSAHPELGESAIEKLLDALAGVREARWPRDREFGDTTLNIGTISGGTRSNVVPGSAAAELHFRLACDSRAVVDALEAAIGGRARIDILSTTEPARLGRVEGVEARIVNFTTDLPHLSNWGERFLVGPGSILDAHTPDERIAKSELLDAVELYAALAVRLLDRVPEAARA